MRPFVTGGGSLSLAIRTAPRAAVTANLDAVMMQTLTVGKGTHRKRVTRRVVFYHAALKGNADAHGRFSPTLRVAYQPAIPVVATLTVRAQTLCSAALQRTTLTILPLRITVRPGRLASGGSLTITLHTGALGRVGITLEVDTRRDTVTGRGRHRHHVRRLVTLYRLVLSGTADRHGQFSRRLRISYRPTKPVPATIRVQVRMSQGTAAGTATTTILPRRHR
jgi:hypothetical protein